jgi:L-fuconolactonase
MARLQLVLDALVRPKHLPSLSRLALRHPELAIVIDHGAKPNLAVLNDWSEEIESIALFPNVNCKLSGLLTELPRGDVASLAWIFERLWNAFGADRLVWGSDWPVLTLAASYGDWIGNCRRLVPTLHHDAVFDLNARRIYGSKSS